jgi:hypothetical protein
MLNICLPVSFGQGFTLTDFLCLMHFESESHIVKILNQTLNSRFSGFNCGLIRLRHDKKTKENRNA